MIAQSAKALVGEIDRMKAIEEFKVKQFGQDWVKGPMKWLVVVLGPNHHFQEIKHLIEQEHKGLNILVVLVSNNKQRGEDRTVLSRSRSVSKPPGFFGDQESKQLDADIEDETRFLNDLCRCTPEGYMVMIESRQFDSKDTTAVAEAKALDRTVGGTLPKPGAQALAKDVEKVFTKICQSMELYQVHNIPIITEFLEF